MQRHTRILAAAAALILLLTACGQSAATFRLDEGLDLDLTKLSGTMVYSEVFNMRYEPDDYYGKCIRIRGLFSAVRNLDTGEYFYNCIIPDATACCSQGIQFIPADALSYPEDFPPEGSTVTVRGTFAMNEENIYMCCLTDAVIEAYE